MKFKTQVIALAACCLFSQNTQATVTFNLQGDLLQTATLGTAAPTSGLVMLVANTTNTTNGPFGSTAIQNGASLAVGANVIPGDVILKEWTVGGASATPGAFYDTTSALTLGSGWATGNPLALLWFPTLTTGASTAVTGTAYGAYTGPGSTGSAAWTTPANGSTVSLDLNTTNAAISPGNLSPATGVASLSVIGAPEPSRAILAALGFGLIALRRRRR